MNVGDLVMLKLHPRGRLNRTGVIVEMVQKKCWRTSKLGKAIAWNKVEPELHGAVLIDDDILTIPITDLKVINENA